MIEPSYYVYCLTGLRGDEALDVLREAAAQLQDQIEEDRSE